MICNEKFDYISILSYAGIVGYVAFYFPRFQLLINISYVLLLISILLSIIKHNKIIYTKFFYAWLIIVFYNFSSVLWATSPSHTMVQSIQFFKASVVAILFMNVIDSEKKFRNILSVTAFSGLLYAIVYFFTIGLDVNSLTNSRIENVIDSDINTVNPNVVSMTVSLSYIYYVFSAFYYKKKRAYLFLGIAAILVFILGSRKSILSILIGTLLFLLRLKSKNKIKVLLSFLILLCFMLMIIPLDYLTFIFERFYFLEDMFSGEKSELDASDSIRSLLVTKGIQYFFENNILFGSGYYSFSDNLFEDIRLKIYAHNNYIETLVGVGLLGFLLFYYLYYIVFRSISLKSKVIDYDYLIFIMMIVILFNNFFIVLLDDRYVWILICVMYTKIKFKVSRYKKYRF